MPYGGVKDSGLGREGLRWAIEDMTEIRIMVLAQPRPEGRDRRSRGAGFADARSPARSADHGGSIVDGSGERPAFAADIGVRGDRIVAVGPMGRDGGPPARRSIDGTGRVVCPGFIDPHTHVESAVTSRSVTMRSARSGWG